jgi:hypothetical protein
VLRADGEEIGHATADSGGRFTAPVRFSTFIAGPREITASCGAMLTTTLQMTLAATSDGVSGEYVVLMFFLVAAFLVVRWQLNSGRR